MRVLVTGAGGQLGRALQETAPAGIDFRGLTHSQLDITREDSVLTAVREISPDAIVNAAAYTAVDRAESEPELCYKANADGVRFLAAGARDTGARLLHVSTDYVFDGSASVPYPPNAAVCPLGVYGASKRLGERAALDMLGERAAVLRTAWVYSAWGTNFVRKMLQLMSERGAVNVVVDQVGSPTSARSVAEALWALVQRAELHGVYHWTDAGVASWYDFAVAIAEDGASLQLVPGEVDVQPISTQQYPTPARRPHYSVLDSHLTNAALDIRPVHWRRNLRETLKELTVG